MSAEAEGVVDDLLALEEGQQVHLEAETYAWASPLEVVTVDREQFVDVDGEPAWMAAEVEVQPDHHAATPKRLPIVEGGSAPELEGYGAIIAVERNGHEPDPPGRLSRPAPEIVATADPTGGDLSLSSVLEAVEGAASLQDVHDQLPIEDYSRTTDLLWELDLRTSKTSLRPDDELEDWIDELRDTYLTNE